MEAPWSRRLAFAVDDAFHGLEPGYLASIRPELAELDKAAIDAAIRRHLRSATSTWSSSPPTRKV